MGVTTRELNVRPKSGIVAPMPEPPSASRSSKSLQKIAALLLKLQVGTNAEHFLGPVHEQSPTCGAMAGCDALLAVSTGIKTLSELCDSRVAIW